MKITASGLCHYDLHIKKGCMDLGHKGKLTFTQCGTVLPLTLDHEIAGVVEEVGSDVGNSPQLRRLIEMYKQGKLKPIPVEVRPLSAINEPIDDLQAGRVTGRIVFNPQDR